jgi:predicted phosphodiesterase
VLAAILGLVGAWLGMRAFAAESTRMGPLSVRLESGFGAGVTEIGLPPVGVVVADTHVAPLRLQATLQDVNVRQLTERFQGRPTQDVVLAIERDALDLILPFALRVLVAGVAGALLLGLLAYRRRWRRVMVSTIVATLAVGGSELAAWASFRPEAFLSPTFRGTLALAPDFIGPVEEATGTIDAFRAELQRVVNGAVRVYEGFQAGGLGRGDEIRVLHISDVHLNPLGMDFAREIARAFDVDLVLDTGDLTSWGTAAEQLILAYVPRFGRPYVFVRGNHDSSELAAAMARQGNATVLDDRVVTVRGLRIYGLGHPVFTREEADISQDEFEAEDEAAGARVAAAIAGLSVPPDIVAVHDDRMAQSVAGRVPLVVSGHFHAAGVKVEDGTIFLRVGTTGGAGETVFADPLPFSAEILYFERTEPHTLVAYDLIEQSPETGSLTVERHLTSSLVEQPSASPSTPASPAPANGQTPSPLPSSPPTPSTPIASGRRGRSGRGVARVAS